MNLRTSSIAVALATLALAGCMGTNKPRIKVRRDPPGPTVEERQDEARKENEENLRLPQDVRANETYMRESGKAIDRTRQTPRDPWASYEADRRSVILQPWADVGKPSPPAEETKAPEEEDLTAMPPKKQPEKKEEGGEGGEAKPDEKKDADKKDDAGKMDADKKDDAAKDEKKDEKKEDKKDE
jgi:hypothetical protein